MPRIHQVFIGCPFSRGIRRNYDRLKRELEAETPLSVVLADTAGASSSDYLLDHITGLIRESAGCIFDATGANPNVCLEVGIAHTVPTNYILTLRTRKPRSGRRRGATSADVRSIISDLQGKNRIEYKTYRMLRQRVEDRFLANLPYMARWRRFRNAHKSMAPHVLKLVADIRLGGLGTRARLEAILEGSGFDAADVARAMRAGGIVSLKRGGKGGFFYPAK